MPSDWTPCTVADVAAPTRNAIVGGPFGSDLVSRDYVEAGIPVIRGTNMSLGRWVDGDFAFVTPEKSESLAANHATPGDIVFTQRGTLGQVAIVPPHRYERYLLSQSQMKLTVDRRKASPLFLYYVFCSNEQQEYIRKNTIQTGVPHTNLGLLKGTPLVLPPLPIQEAIARILGALDDKIELNRKMNATLEAMARALFKSWFVDAPEADWQTAPLAEWVDVLSGGTPSMSNPALWGGWLKWISPKSMMSIHADECDDHVTEQAIGNGTRIAPKGSTLVMVRGMGLHHGVRVSQAREDVTFNQDVKALVPRKIEADLLFFAMLDAQQELHKRVETSGHGTGKMPSEILLARPLTMPPRDVQRERVEHFSALNDRVAANRAESRNLERMRDELLPRLLSGELDVRACAAAGGAR